MIFEVGYNEPIEGQEVYETYKNRKKTRSNILWNNILQRCYDPKLHTKEPTYIGTECYNEWLNYQAFAKWYENNFYEIEGEKMELDKDLLSKDGKIY